MRVEIGSARTAQTFIEIFALDLVLQSSE